jgi:hypothetical protein
MTTMLETNKPNLPVYGLLHVACTLELIDSHRGATSVANSILVAGRRTIAVRLCSGHLIVSKALARADTLTVRFLISLSLVEKDAHSLVNAYRKVHGKESS